jgi:D-alanyl-D-alanine carboxypeptidase
MSTNKLVQLNQAAQQHLFSGAMIAKKGNNRVTVVVFGGKNTKILTAQMIEVARLGFRK